MKWNFQTLFSTEDRKPEQKVLTFIVISFLDKKKNYKKLTKNSKRAIDYSGPDSGKDIFDNSIHV